MPWMTVLPNPFSSLPELCQPPHNNMFNRLLVDLQQTFQESSAFDQCQLDEGASKEYAIIIIIIITILREGACFATLHLSQREQKNDNAIRATEDFWPDCHNLPLHNGCQHLM